jgi:hypothetical protein
MGKGNVYVERNLTEITPSRGLAPGEQAQSCRPSARPSTGLGKSALTRGRMSSGSGTQIEGSRTSGARASAHLQSELRGLIHQG